jgi:RNA:NAD 2'-phosphotransferase (TPT1/KptA family)
LTPGRLARLAYAGQDGLPRVIPIGFHWDGRQIIVCTATTAPKVRALSRRPEVALTIDTEDSPAKALLVRGEAGIEIVDGVPNEYLAASSKSMDAALDSHVGTVSGPVVRRALAGSAVRGC